MAGERGAADYLTIIAVERRCDAHCLRRASPAQPQRIGIVGEIVDQHLVARDVGRCLRSPAQKPFQFSDGMRDAVPRDAVSLELCMRDVMATVGSLDLDWHQH
jgi:hypothetical protein